MQHLAKRIVQAQESSLVPGMESRLQPARLKKCNHARKISAGLADSHLRRLKPGLHTRKPSIFGEILAHAFTYVCQRFASLTLFVAFSGLVTTAWAGLKVGTDFPNLASFQFEGDLPANLAGKIVIVDFWASWCAPCKKSFPVLDELQKKFREQGLVIIAVNEDQKRSDMEHFLKENKASFTVIRDAAPDGKKLVDKVDVSAMPSTLIIDGNGKVRFIHNGFLADTKKEYEQEIESLLKGMK